jgi:hypothetical protein
LAAVAILAVTATLLKGGKEKPSTAISGFEKRRKKIFIFWFYHKDCARLHQLSITGHLPI